MNMPELEFPDDQGQGKVMSQDDPNDIYTNEENGNSCAEEYERKYMLTFENQGTKSTKRPTIMIWTPTHSSLVAQRLFHTYIHTGAVIAVALGTLKRTRDAAIQTANTEDATNAIGSNSSSSLFKSNSLA